MKMVDGGSKYMTITTASVKIQICSPSNVRSNDFASIWIDSRTVKIHSRFTISCVMAVISCKAYSIACVFVFREIPIGALYGKFDREDSDVHLVAQELDRIGCFWNRSCTRNTLKATINHKKADEGIIDCMSRTILLFVNGRSPLMKSASLLISDQWSVISDESD